MNDLPSVIAPIIDDFLRSYRCSGSKSDTLSMQLGMRRFTEFLATNPYITSISAIERWEIEKYISFLTTYEYWAKDPYRPNFIYRNLRALSKFFEYLTVNSDRLDRSLLPKAGLIRHSDFPAPNRRSSKHFPDSLDSALHDGIINMKLQKDIKHERGNNLKFQTQMMVFYHTGMRINDVINLEQDCIIFRGKNPWMRIFARKVKRYYEIPIVDELYNAIEKYKEVYAEELSRISSERIPDTDVYVKRLFAPSMSLSNEDDYEKEKNKIGGKVTRFCKKVMKEAESNGVDMSDVKEGYSVTAHKFRHNVAKKLVRLGADPLTIAEFIGHNGLSMAQAYIQEDQEHILSLMNELTDMGILEGYDMRLMPNLYSAAEILGHPDQVRKVNGGYCTFLNGDSPCGNDPYRCWDCENLTPEINDPDYPAFLQRQKDGHEMLLQRAKGLGLTEAIEKEEHVLFRIKTFQNELEKSII